MFQKLRHSLTARLLALFTLVSLLIVGLLVASMIHAISSQWRYGFAPHIEQYLDYVNADLSYPPNQQRATELAAKLPINIYIEGPGTSFSTSGRKLDVADLEFEKRKRKRRHRPDTRIDIGEHRERTVLRNQTGEFKVYYELQHRNNRARREGLLWIPVLILAAILGGCYLVLRKMLRPVQDIKTAVLSMGSGHLDTRVPVRSTNDLGVLSGSINTMASDIEKLLSAKRQLLLGASHELRTPITRAKVAAEMLDESTNRSRNIEDLDEMESLIADIMESERVTGGHSALNISGIDIKELLSSVLQDLRDSHVETNFANHLPDVQADTTRLRLLFRNLISNALEHGSGQKPPLVETDTDGDFVSVTITDYGSGIPSEHLDKITEPFYRADPSRARATGGFGLGLHICELIVAAHGGTLTIDSQTASGDNKQSGTRVMVRLPVLQT